MKKLLLLAPFILTACSLSGEENMSWHEAPKDPKVKAYLYVLCLKFAKDMPIGDAQ